MSYLEENQVASVAVLSRAWGLTRADIRYHLNALRKQGLIELVTEGGQQPDQRGRPAQLFRLSNTAGADNLPTLCAALLDVFTSQPTQPQAGEVFSQLAARLAGDTQAVGSSTQRLNQAVAQLNQHAYHARWEARAGGPQVIFRHCPYAAVLPGRPQLCQIDRLLLERLTGLAWQQSSRINLLTGHPAACTFTVLR